MNIEKNNNPVKSRKIIKRCTHSSTISSMYAGENLDTFPMDLINEILKRLPAKTIAICQCVSKQWAFLLGSPHFTKSFLTCSTTRPRLLFTFELGGKWHFFSSPQPRNADEQLITIWMSNGNTKLERVPVLCNPSTGQHVHLPKVKAKNKDFRSFLGSDPQTVNFISVLLLIQKETWNGRDIIGKISMPDFQIIYPIVKSTYG
ncbi:hypothetical protein F2Q70_00020936 [Brassica cretica]|uniref:F-box domain-containing protein n=1 Tax=Brassica cretica TaxID=69181 RepID=A0A8S9GUY1_BRACR|nr:hypothetical protein F2Q70_00020936 [Brassica cretica]